MDKKDLTNLGDDIKKIVNDSLNSGDYRKMGQDISSTVNNALDSTLKDVRKMVNSVQMENQHLRVPPKAPQVPKVASVEQTRRGSRHKRQLKTVNTQSSNRIYFPHVPVGRLKATLFTVFGTLGIVIFGLLILIAGAANASPWLLGGLLIGAIGSLAMDMQASSIRSRLKRYKRYLSLFLGRDSCSIEELSSYSGYSHRYLVKDLWKMIDIGMLPQAHIDDRESIIMLNRGRYDKYLIEQQELQLIEKEKANFQNQLGQTGNIELETAVAEGKQFVTEISKANASIQDEEVTFKVLHMESVIDKIVVYIELHPEQLPDVRRFMQYYLPTTLKLLNAYSEFEKQTIQGENIKTAKSEIKEALDTINLAFENLFDNLFASASMDVSTDISVLHTMMAQEGLTEQDFKMNKTEGGNK